jgi:hypothetical protein
LGFQIHQLVPLRIVNNRIVYGTAHGVAVLDGGSGLIKDNLIASNAGAGVCIGGAEQVECS